MLYKYFLLKQLCEYLLIKHNLKIPTYRRIHRFLICQAVLAHAALKARRLYFQNSTLPNDKKRELEEIILSYNDKLTSSQGINKYYFGNLLIDIIGCDYLFKVIPKYDIPTYNEFSSYDSESEEFAIFIQQFEVSVTGWFEDMLNALKKYVSIDDENVLSQVIIDMLYPIGHGGMVRYYKNDKLTMICRMLYRMLNIPLFEGEK